MENTKNQEFNFKTPQTLTLNDTVSINIAIRLYIERQREYLKVEALTRTTEDQERLIEQLTHLRNIRKAFDLSWQIKQIDKKYGYVRKAMESVNTSLYK